MKCKQVELLQTQKRQKLHKLISNKGLRQKTTIFNKSKQTQNEPKTKPNSEMNITLYMVKDYSNLCIHALEKQTQNPNKA